MPTSLSLGAACLGDFFVGYVNASSGCTPLPSPQFLRLTSSMLFLSAKNLWRLTRTAMTLIHDFGAIGSPGNPRNFACVNNSLLFSAGNTTSVVQYHYSGSGAIEVIAAAQVGAYQATIIFQGSLYYFESGGSIRKFISPSLGSPIVASSGPGNAIHPTVISTCQIDFSFPARAN